MFGRFARRRLVASLAVAAVVCAAAAVAAGNAAGDRDAPAPTGIDTRVVVGDRPLSPPLRGGFVGLSLEFSALLPYTGTDPGAVDPVFEQLIRNLAPGQQPVLRIGGDSGDWSWIPVRGLRRPRGVSYTISPRWLRVLRAAARALGARLILGVDLQAGSPALAAGEGRAFMAALGRRYVRALEIGNEPHRYDVLPWYRVARRRPVFARRRGYDFTAFAREFASVRRRLPAVPLAGPTVGSLPWLAHLGGFLAAEPRVALATVHRYPLNRCFTPLRSVVYPTLEHLLGGRASRGLAAELAPYVALAHRRGVAFRVDELNSVACGGQAGLSDTLASALWSLDTLFSLAGAGVDGVNLHTFPGARYEPFAVRRAGGRWSASVRPEYYGLLMFARAAPPGSRLVPVHVAGAPDVRAWATVGSAGRLRVVLLNESARRHVAAISVGGGNQTGTVERLLGPGLDATSGITLGGRSFGPTTFSGMLGPPRTGEVEASRGGFAVALPAAGAALLTVRVR